MILEAIKSFFSKINQIGALGFSIGWINSFNANLTEVMFELDDYTTEVDEEHSWYAAKMPLKIINVGDTTAFNINFIAFIKFPESQAEYNIVLNHMALERPNLKAGESYKIGTVYFPYKITSSFALEVHNKNPEKRPVISTIVTTTDFGRKFGLISKSNYRIQPNRYETIKNRTPTLYAIFNFFRKDTETKKCNIDEIDKENMNMVAIHNTKYNQLSPIYFETTKSNEK